jgi:anti-sigma factor (TIGR02949 family)
MSHVDRYTCEDLIRKLDDYLDRRLDEEETRLVLEHLATCAICTMEYNFEAATLEELRQKARRIDAPADLLSRILTKIRTEGDKDPT